MEHDDTITHLSSHCQCHMSILTIIHVTATVQEAFEILVRCTQGPHSRKSVGQPLAFDQIKNPIGYWWGFASSICDGSVHLYCYLDWRARTLLLSEWFRGMDFILSRRQIIRKWTPMVLLVSSFSARVNGLDVTWLSSHDRGAAPFSTHLSLTTAFYRWRWQA